MSNDHERTSTIINAFVGREPELAVLRAELQRAAAGNARCVLISGAAGIGKTALLDRALSGAGDATIVRGNGDESEQTLPLGLVDQLLRRARAERPAHAGGTDHVAAGTHLLEVVAELEAAAPVVVAVDDAHWADALSLRAILFVARRLVSERVLVVLTAREDELAALPPGLRAWAEGEDGLHLRLAPLPAADIRELAGRFGIALSSGAAERLHAHTAGSPLYATTLLRELTPERWREPGEWPAPRSFAALVRARAATLPDASRRLLDAAAVLGLSTRLDLVAQLAGSTAPLEAVEAAAEAGLVELVDRETTRDVAFRHPLIRAALYQGLGVSTRARLHAAAAGLMEGEAAALRHRTAAASGPDPELAAELERFAAAQRAGGAWPQVAVYLVAAGRLSDDRAERERRTLLALEAFLFAGDVPAARRLAPETAAFADSPLRDSVSAYLAISNGEAERAGHLLDRAWEHVDPQVEPRLAITVAQRQAFLAVLRLRPADAVEWSRRAEALPVDDDMTTGLIVWTLALGLDQLGRGDEARAVYDAAAARMRSNDSLGPNGAMLLLTADEFAAARDTLRVVAPRVRAIGSLIVAAVTYARLVRAEWSLGEWDDALVHGEQSVAVAIESDDVAALAFARWAAILVHAGRGSLTEAGEHAAALAAIPVVFDNHVLAAAIGLAHYDAARGDSRRVRRRLEPFTRLQPRDGVDDGSTWPWQDLYADALVDLGALDEAAAFVAAQERAASLRNRRSTLAKLARVRGRIAMAAGDPERARATLADAVTLITPLGMPYEQARAELAYGQFLRREGQRRAAATQLEAARERLETLGAAPLLERCVAELEACGLSPAAGTHGQREHGLTPQERAVARLAADGLGNREIAAQLMVSVKTVERHLTHVFSKLDISSRRELPRQP